MHKIFKGALLASFIVGVVLYPAWHKASCESDAGTDCACHAPAGETRGPCGAENHDGRPDHDPQKCPACQLAITPLQAASAALAPVAVISVCETIIFPSALPIIRTFCDSHLARGPPKV